MNTARVDRMTKRLGVAAALIGFLYWIDVNTDPIDMDDWFYFHSEPIDGNPRIRTTPEEGPGVVEVLKDQRLYWNRGDPWLWIALAALTIGPFCTVRLCGWVLKGSADPEQDGKSD